MCNLLVFLRHVVHTSGTLCTHQARCAHNMHVVHTSGRSLFRPHSFSCTLCTHHARCAHIMHVVHTSCTLCTHHARCAHIRPKPVPTSLLSLEWTLLDSCCNNEFCEFNIIRFVTVSESLFTVFLSLYFEFREIQLYLMIVNCSLCLSV